MGGWDALLICMAAFMLVSMARLHSVLPFVSALRPALLVGILALVIFLFSESRERALKHLGHPITLLVGFFVLWAAIGAPFGLYPGKAVRFLTNDFSRVLLFFVLVAACVRNLMDVRRLLMTLAIGGMVFSLFAALPAGFKGVEGGGYDPNDSAMFIASSFPLIMYFMIRERRLVLKIVFALALVVCTIAIVRTGSRGGFLAFVAVVGYCIFLFQGVKPVFRVLTVAGVIGVMTLAAGQEYWSAMETINDPDDYNHTSPTGRKAIWERARGYMAENPVFGVGITNFSVAEGRHPMIAESIERGRGFKYSAAHSMWYQVGTETGFPGLAAFAGLFLTSVFYLRRVVKRTRRAPEGSLIRESGGLASALIGSFVAVLVAGTFLSNAYWAMVWGLFALALAMLKALRFEGYDMSRPAARPGPQPAVRRGRAPRGTRAFAPAR
jgi:putative inorganic carbon (hco3(-)) transporter